MIHQPSFSAWLRTGSVSINNCAPGTQYPSVAAPTGNDPSIASTPTRVTPCKRPHRRYQRPQILWSIPDKQGTSNCLFAALELQAVVLFVDVFIFSLRYKPYITFHQQHGVNTMDVSDKVSPSLHPSNVKAIKGYNDSTSIYVAPVVDAFKFAYEGLENIWTAREAASKNPTWNEPEQIIRTDDYADKIFNKITAKFDSTMDGLKRGINHVEQELAAPITDSGSTSVAAEIRSHAKSLSPEERRRFLSDAQQARDHITLGAVLAAPGYLSGIDETERQLWTRRYHEANSPELAQRLQVMKAAQGLLDTRCGMVFSERERAVGAAPHKVRALREAKASSEAAFIRNPL